MKKLIKILMTIFLLTMSGCLTDKEYKWAFAQNMDNTFLTNEYCRESLANSIYDESNKQKITRQANTHVYMFNGSIESYRIYGFKTQSECETALTNMKVRQSN